ncbi:L,D-transpeptidase family protein [Halomonas sp. WWR20]
MATHCLRALAIIVLLTATTAHAALKDTLTSATPQPGTAAVTLWHELDALALPAVAADEIWVSIDLEERKLAVYQGERCMLTIPYLAIGTAGAKRIRLRGSSQTPTGSFRIDRINRQSRFTLFFGIDYPTPQIAREAWQNGILSDYDYRDYLRYRRQHGVPPASTPLGGHIGIHGLGARPASIHRIIDWTQGCIAVTNSEIQALDRWLNIGTLVVIR